MAFGGVADASTRPRSTTGAMAYATSGNGASFALGSGALDPHQRRLQRLRHGRDRRRRDAVRLRRRRLLRPCDPAPRSRRELPRADCGPVDVVHRATTPTARHWHVTRRPRTSTPRGTPTAPSKDGIWAQKVWPVDGRHWSRRRARRLRTAALRRTRRSRSRLDLVEASGRRTPSAGPSRSKIRLWKVGTSTYRDIKAPGAKEIALTAGPRWTPVGGMERQQHRTSRAQQQDRHPVRRGSQRCRSERQGVRVDLQDRDRRQPRDRSTSSSTRTYPGRTTRRCTTRSCTHRCP